MYLLFNSFLYKDFPFNDNQRPPQRASARDDFQRESRDEVIKGTIINCLIFNRSLFLKNFTLNYLPRVNILFISIFRYNCSI